MRMLREEAVKKFGSLWVWMNHPNVGPFGEQNRYCRSFSPEPFQPEKFIFVQTLGFIEDIDREKFSMVYTEDQFQSLRASLEAQDERKLVCINLPEMLNLPYMLQRKQLQVKTTTETCVCDLDISSPVFIPTYANPEDRADTYDFEVRYDLCDRYGQRQKYQPTYLTNQDETFKPVSCSKEFFGTDYYEDAIFFEDDVMLAVFINRHPQSTLPRREP